MTRFGKIIISCIVLSILISVGIISAIIFQPKFDFSLTDRGYKTKRAYLIEELGDSGKYYINCSSGYGVLQINNQRYSLKSKDIKIIYKNRFLNNYYTDCYITIPKEALIGVLSQSKENFIVEFTYCPGGK